MPLYDILNQFQKGHSHMAAVVKCKNDVKETAEKTKTKSSMLEVNINPISKQREAKIQGRINDFYIFSVYMETQSF